MQYTNISTDFGVRNITFVIYRGIRRQFPVFSRQSSVGSRQFAVCSWMATLSWAQKPGFSSQADWIAPTFKSRAAHDQSAVFSPQSAVGSQQSAVQWPRFHERKNLAFQARPIELPRLSSRGPLMISRQSSVGSFQSAVFSPQWMQ